MKDQATGALFCTEHASYHIDPETGRATNCGETTEMAKLEICTYWEVRFAPYAVQPFIKGLNFDQVTDVITQKVLDPDGVLKTYWGDIDISTGKDAWINLNVAEPSPGSAAWEAKSTIDSFHAHVMTEIARTTICGYSTASRIIGIDRRDEPSD
jgi:hypothetical protein